MGGYVSRANRISAEQLAKRIELDIACGNYDESLDRYRSTQQKNDAAYKKLMAGLRKRLQERFNLADHALLGTIEVYGSPICDRGEAEEFFIWLRDVRGLAASSRRRYRETLRVVSPELFDEIDIERVPRKLPQPFTKTEVVSILEYFTGTHWGEFVSWQLNTGMRPSETIGLRWQDVDWDSGTVKVESRLRRRQGSS